MQITDEVTSDEKQKMLILNWPKPRQQRRFKAFHEYDGRRKLSN
jgi:hypothetical protein